MQLKSNVFIATVLFSSFFACVDADKSLWIVHTEWLPDPGYWHTDNNQGHLHVLLALPL